MRQLRDLKESSPKCNEQNLLHMLHVQEISDLAGHKVLLHFVGTKSRKNVEILHSSRHNNKLKRKQEFLI